MKTTFKNTILMNALINGILGWMVFALVVCLIHADIDFTQVLLTTKCISVGVLAAAGSCLGYMIREDRLGR